MQWLSRLSGNNLAVRFENPLSHLIASASGRAKDVAKDLLVKRKLGPLVPKVMPVVKSKLADV